MEKLLGDRFNEGKPQWSLVDFKSIEPMVRVLEHGKEKYGRGNWQLGLDKMEICESLLRHVFAYLSGEIVDSESGIQHTGHMLANAMFLEYMENHFNNK